MFKCEKCSNDEIEPVDCNEFFDGEEAVFTRAKVERQYR